LREFAAAAAAALMFFCVQQRQLREKSAATSEHCAATNSDVHVTSSKGTGNFRLLNSLT
jgi:hypothetical protein